MVIYYKKSMEKGLQFGTFLEMYLTEQFYDDYLVYVDVTIFSWD